LLALTTDRAWRDGTEDNTVTPRSHAAVVSAMWVGTRGKVRSCPRCRHLCSATLGGGRRGRPGERSRVNLSQLIIGRLLLAAAVCRLLVTSEGNDAYRLHGTPYRSSYCSRYNAALSRLFPNFEQNSNSCKRTSNV